MSLANTNYIMHYNKMTATCFSYASTLHFLSLPPTPLPSLCSFTHPYNSFPASFSSCFPSVVYASFPSQPPSPSLLQKHTFSVTPSPPLAISLPFTRTVPCQSWNIRQHIAMYVSLRMSGIILQRKKIANTCIFKKWIAYGVVQFGKV